MSGAFPLAGRVQPPLARDTLELARAPVVELEAGAGDEILDGARHEHLARARIGGDARTCVDGDPRDLAVDELALACVKSGSDLDPERSNCFGDRTGATDRACRAIEGRQKTVTNGVHLAAACPAQLTANERVVLLEQLAPTRVAELGHLRSRADDVGEHNRREHAIRLLLDVRRRPGF